MTPGQLDLVARLEEGPLRLGSLFLVHGATWTGEDVSQLIMRGVVRMNGDLLELVRHGE